MRSNLTTCCQCNNPKIRESAHLCQSSLLCQFPVAPLRCQCLSTVSVLLNFVIDLLATCRYVDTSNPIHFASAPLLCPRHNFASASALCPCLLIFPVPVSMLFYFVWMHVSITVKSVSVPALCQSPISLYQYPFSLCICPFSMCICPFSLCICPFIMFCSSLRAFSSIAWQVDVFYLILYIMLSITVMSSAVHKRDLHFQTVMMDLNYDHEGFEL